MLSRHKGRVCTAAQVARISEAPLNFSDRGVHVPRLRAQHGLPFPHELFRVHRLPEWVVPATIRVAQHAAGAAAAAEAAVV